MKINTVTIALCAYNEEKNILQCLQSLLTQEEKGFIIKEIIIVSDGSTDKTVKLVKSFENKKINLVAHKSRAGKSRRLNRIYKNLDTDFLIQTDADVLFGNSLVVYNLINRLNTDKRIGMVGGNPIPIAGSTFVERAINTTTIVYREYRSVLRGGNNIFSADGRVLGFRAKFIKSIKIPHTMIANDAYVYFCCMQTKYLYNFVSESVVYYRSPQTIQDHIRQNIRFIAAHFRFKRIFPKKLVNREYFIPFSTMVYLQITTAIGHPLESVFIFSLNIFCRIAAYINENKLQATWDIAQTTKSFV